MKYIIKIDCYLSHTIRYLTIVNINKINDEGDLNQATKKSLRLMRLYTKYTYKDTRIVCNDCKLSIKPYHEELNNVR